MIPFFDERSVLKKRLGLVLRMRSMVYSSKDFNYVDFCRDSTKYAFTSVSFSSVSLQKSVTKQ